MSDIVVSFFKCCIDQSIQHPPKRGATDQTNGVDGCTRYRLFLKPYILKLGELNIVSIRLTIDIVI